MAEQTTRERVREHRARLRAQGLRPVEFWLPDMDSPEFIAQAHEASLRAAQSPHAQEDQEFVESISDTWD